MGWLHGYFNYYYFLNENIEYKFFPGLVRVFSLFTWKRNVPKTEPAEPECGPTRTTELTSALKHNNT